MLAAADTQSKIKDDEAELDADLLTMNTERVSLGNIPHDFVSFILERPGDFCISTTVTGSYVLSIKSDADKTFHLALENAPGGGYRIRSMLFARGATIGELIYNIRDSSLDMLSGVLGCSVYPRRMITKNVLQKFRIYDDDAVISKKLVHEGVEFRYYQSHMLLNKEFYNTCLKESRRMSSAEWRAHMFDELRVSFLATELQLPLRKVYGILRADNGYVIYDSKPGCNFSRFLDENDERLDLGMRIKLCRALTSVMSALLDADIYCGTVKLKNFYVYFADALPYGRIQLMFTNGADLSPTEEMKPIERGDFTKMAPEVSWTRMATPESGVYSMGLVLQAVIGDTSEFKSSDPNYTLLPRAVSIVERCLHPRPSERPTMNGLFIEFDKLNAKVQHTDSQRWTPI
ncbi:hypothetical protein Q1695_003025 [Nippostrongylus brasiliensis]|nr:hypothetical protein Q1695_003025 [Nippostrongylus brasiliensis]